MVNISRSTVLYIHVMILSTVYCNYMYSNVCITCSINASFSLSPFNLCSSSSLFNSSLATCWADTVASSTADCDRALLLRNSVNSLEYTRSKINLKTSTCYKIIEIVLSTVHVLYMYMYVVIRFRLYKDIYPYIHCITASVHIHCMTRQLTCRHYPS